MFRHIFSGPCGVIKIPWTSNICFEGEVPGAVVDLALQTGETAAKVEQVEEEQTELGEKLENLEMRQRWNDDTLDRTFERIWALEARIEILEAGPVEEEPATETIIAEPEQKKPEKRASWSLF